MQLVSTLLETYMKMKNPLSNVDRANMRVKPKTKYAKSQNLVLLICTATYSE